MVPPGILTSGAFLSALTTSAGGFPHIQSILTFAALATGVLVVASYITTRIILHLVLR